MEKTDSWEKQTISQLANASLIEQRKARRWGVFFKFSTLGYLVLLTILIFQSINPSSPGTGTSHHSALVRLYGEIGMEEQASAENIIAGLDDAFENLHHSMY